MYVIIVYDIQIDRINEVRKFLRKYLNWIQNSVFEGELTISELETIKHELELLINKEKDHVIIYKFRSLALVKKYDLGKLKFEPSTII